MGTPGIVTATPEERERVLSSLTVAFSNDPVTRWAFPDPHQYMTYFPEVVKYMGGGAFEHGGAFRTDDYSGASLWLPPNVHSDGEALAGVAQQAVPESDQEKVFGFLAQMETYHPTEPHWYLPFIGVDPVRQGAGYGSAMLIHALKNADRDKLPAYLEATSPGSKRLYERHGFEATGEIQHADSPPMWPMLRKPR
jgi:ribosomal protein S18 acetylase RimI-like enzyme